MPLGDAQPARGKRQRAEPGNHVVHAFRRPVEQQDVAGAQRQAGHTAIDALALTRHAQEADPVKAQQADLVDRSAVDTALPRHHGLREQHVVAAEILDDVAAHH